MLTRYPEAFCSAIRAVDRSGSPRPSLIIGFARALAGKVIPAARQSPIVRRHSGDPLATRRRAPRSTPASGRDDRATTIPDGQEKQDDGDRPYWCWRTAGSTPAPSFEPWETLGEAVFSTGMSGYQETLTDRAITARSWWPPPRRSATPAGTLRGRRKPRRQDLGGRLRVRDPRRGRRTGGHRFRSTTNWSARTSSASPGRHPRGGHPPPAHRGSMKRRRLLRCGAGRRRRTGPPVRSQPSMLGADLPAR